jgi:hypothetical protein
MTLDTVPALMLLALCCAAFLRFGCVRDDDTAGDDLEPRGGAR